MRKKGSTSRSSSPTRFRSGQQSNVNNETPSPSPTCQQQDSNHNQIAIDNRQQEQQQDQQLLQQLQLLPEPQPQEQQQVLEINELKSYNFVASIQIPTTDRQCPIHGFQIQEVLPNTALPPLSSTPTTPALALLLQQQNYINTSNSTIMSNSNERGQSSSQVSHKQIPQAEGFVTSASTSSSNPKPQAQTSTRRKRESLICFIDLVSSDDEELPNKKVKQQMESNNNHSLNNSNHQYQFLQNSWDSYNRENEQLIEKFKELLESNSAEQFTTLECLTIQFGSYKSGSSTINKDKLTVLLSTLGIYFKLAHSISGDSIECAIPISQVLSCYGHFSTRRPFLFLYTKSKLGRYYSTKLGCCIGLKSWNYACKLPHDVLCLNACITLELKSPEEMDLQLIRKVFQNVNVYVDINCPIAKEILAATYKVTQKIAENEYTNKMSLNATATESHNPTTRSKSSAIDLNQTELGLLQLPNLGIEISTRDIACLNENNFINDNIIDFYLDQLYQNVLTPEQQEKCFVYPTHFYYLLNRNKNQVDRKLDKNSSSTEQKHSKVAKITKDVDIFSKDFLFIPICNGFHWYLAVICFPGLKCPHDLETNEELAEFKTLDKKTQAGYPKKIKQPLILIFDSLCKKRGRAFTLLRDYIIVEYSKKRSADGFVMDKDTLGEIFVMPKVPQQTNGIDCGLFVLEYFRYFFQDPITDYKHYIVFREKKNWFHPLLVSNLRRDIYYTLYPLLEENCPEHLKNIPQVKFREYVDPATVKFVIHKGDNKNPSADTK